MIRILALSLCAAGLLAQTNGAPPAKVDKALRERATEFHKLLISGQARDAEKLVAPDSKDYYYSASKPKLLDFQLDRIQYSDNFTRARVTALCGQYVTMPGFVGAPVKLPVISTWKVYKGKWYWYIDPVDLRRTPFGVMGNTTSANAGGAPGMPGSIPSTPEMALGRVKPDRSTVILKPGESAEVIFTNSAPGVMSLALNGKSVGLEVSPEKLELPANGKGSVTVRAAADAASVSFAMRVVQTGETLPVQVQIPR
jgi:hypothetical protein